MQVSERKQAAPVGPAAGLPRATGSRRLAWDRRLLLLIPMLIVLLALFTYPTFEILRRAFTSFVDPQVGGLDNFRWFVETDLNTTILRRTFVTALLVTAICLLLGYPYALLMVRAGRRVRAVLAGVVLLAFFTSFMVRNYSWLVLLQDQGLLNDALAALGFGRVEFLGNLSGVAIGMVQTELPLMILPLYATMRGIDPGLIRAAVSLGARPLVAFLRVQLPLSAPGILAGSLLVFVFALGFYITPTLLGSPQQALISQQIVNEIRAVLAWGRAGVISIVLLALTLVSLWFVARVVGRAIVTAPQEAGKGLGGAPPAQSPASRLALAGLAGFTALLLIAPSLAVFPASFNDRPAIEVPPNGWSTQWYENFFTEPAWYESTVNSLLIAFLVAVLATAVAIPAAIAMTRARVPARGLVNGFMLAPIIVPVVVFAVGLYAVFLELHLVGRMEGFVLAHLPLALPVAVVPLVAALQTLDPRLDDAAASLGAGPLDRFRKVTLPIILPSVLTAALFAFVTSFDEVVTSIFLSTVEYGTLPVQMYNSVTKQTDPTMAAASAMLLVLTVAVLLVVVLVRRRAND
jgi:putative spermidine/putrescine transport system permease protein